MRPLPTSLTFLPKSAPKKASEHPRENKGCCRLEVLFSQEQNSPSLPTGEVRKLTSSACGILSLSAPPITAGDDLAAIDSTPMLAFLWFSIIISTDLLTSSMLGSDASTSRTSLRSHPGAFFDPIRFASDIFLLKSLLSFSSARSHGGIQRWLYSLDSRAYASFKDSRKPFTRHPAAHNRLS